MTCVSTNREPQSGGLPIHAAPARRGTPHRQRPHPSTETRTPASADRRHPSRQRRWAGTRAPASPTAGTLGGGDSAAAGVRVHPAPRSQAHRDSGASEDLTSRSTTVSEAEARPSSAKDLELVAEHGRFDVPLLDAAADEQTEQPGQQPIPEGPEHLGKSEGKVGQPANGEVRAPIEFL